MDRIFLTHADYDLTLDKLLIDAARTDNVDQLSTVFDEPEKFDINYQDGWVYKVK
jgi:hypothetical protein